MYNNGRNGRTQEIAHIWAQQNPDNDYRERKSDNVFFRGATIYSYGTHFPMATIITRKDGTRFNVVNGDSYSPTTSNHQRCVRQAIHGETVYCNTRQLQTIARLQSYTDIDAKLLKQHWKVFAQEVSDEVINTINLALKIASGKRTAKSQQKVLDEAIASYNATLQLLRAFNLKPSVKAIKRVDALQQNATALMEQYGKELEAEKRKRERAQVKLQKENKERAEAALAVWLANGSMTYKEENALQYLDKVYMKVKTPDIVTTKGARFPIEQAKQLFPIIQRVKGRFFDISNVKDEALRLGNYRVDNIDAQGNVTAGCHYVEYPQIEAVAKQLGLI